jgi:signal transduction histidine kinase
MSDYIARINLSTRKMQALVSDLLDLSRIHRKGRPFQTVNLDEVFQTVIMDLQPLIEKMGAHIQAQPLPQLEADPLQMQQLFQNLLENALKFHRPNIPPEIRISSKTSDVGYHITIQDNGIGIEPQHQERIFKIFERLHPHQYEGTGIGLSICKKIVERHNGTLQIQSKLGQGSRFMMTLPSKQPVETF